MNQKVKMDDIVSLCKRRGFIYQGSEVYGGLSGTWDYGPLGVQLKRNIMNLWWRMFVDERGRASFVKHIRETGGVPLRTDNPAPYDIIGQLFSPFLQYHSTDAVFRLYHTTMPRVEQRPQYPIDVWLIFDAHAYEPCDGSEDFRQAFRLRDGYDRRASLLGIAQIN